MLFDQQQFIKDHITLRQSSLFSEDISNYQEELLKKIDNKRVLVIGGAGTIGSNYIKAIISTLSRERSMY